MAIIIRGKSKCPLCGKLLEEGQEIVSFSPFVGNELDPLWKFSDNAFHTACFQEDHLAEEAQRRYEQLRKHVAPDNRKCIVCKREIKDPDDYFALGHLVEDHTHPLYRYNYVQAHRSCLPEWSELTQLFKLIKELRESGSWRGSTLDRLLGELEDAGRPAA